MTFSTYRNAVKGGEMFVEMSLLQKQSKNNHSTQISSIMGNSKNLPPLMKAGKEMSSLGNPSDVLRSVFNPSGTMERKKTKKEE